MYKKIPEAERPRLEANDVDMATADGSHLSDLGKVHLKVKIDNREYEHSFIEANVTYEGILGNGFSSACATDDHTALPDSPSISQLRFSASSLGGRHINSLRLYIYIGCKLSLADALSWPDIVL